MPELSADHCTSIISSFLIIAFNLVLERNIQLGGETFIMQKGFIDNEDSKTNLVKLHSNFFMI